MTVIGDPLIDVAGARSRAPDLALADAGPPTSGRRAKSPECRSTRAAMHDYLDRHLPPRRQRHFEAHLDGCAECIRAFIDIREISWTRRGTASGTGHGPHDSTP